MSGFAFQDYDSLHGSDWYRHEVRCTLDRPFHVAYPRASGYRLCRRRSFVMILIVVKDGPQYEPSSEQRFP